MIEEMVEMECRFTVQEIVDILGIDEDIAQYLLEGLIEWEDEEVDKLAQAKGFSVEQLIF